MEGIKVYWTVVVVLVAAGLAALCIKSIGEIAKARSADNIGYLTEHKAMMTEENINALDASSNPCSFDIRKDWLRKKCEEMEVPLAEKDNIIPRPSYTIGPVLLDHKKKTLGCLITEARTKDWISYIIDAKPQQEPGNNNTWFASTQKLRFQDPIFLQMMGLEYIPALNMEEVVSKYKDWSKYVVARHPLQRLVSAYKNSQNKIFQTISNNEFMARLASGELINKQAMWTQYTAQCKLCQVDYNQVIKVETFKDDVISFIHLTEDTDRLDQSPEKLNISSQPDLYKYDQVFRDLKRSYPRVLEHVLDLYEVDMDLLGYHWDRSQEASYCSLDSGNSRTCC